VRVYEERASGRHERSTPPDEGRALGGRDGRHVRHTPPDEQLWAKPEVPPAGALELKARLDSGELTDTQYQVALLALKGRAQRTAI